MADKINKILSNPDDPNLSTEIVSINEHGQSSTVSAVTEKPVTLYLNAREVVTIMTTGDHMSALAVGYLFNQGMLEEDNPVTAIEYDPEIDVIVVRTAKPTSYEKKLARMIRTSGCAMGTAFGDIMDSVANIKLSGYKLHTSWLYQLTKKINSLPSLYLKTGGIHGCALCERDDILMFIEDIGRHNAVDKIAGYTIINAITTNDKIFYTSGRLTSEMVLKTIKMEVPILVSRSGFTSWAVDLALRANLTMIARARGQRFSILAGHENVIFDAEVKHESSNKKALIREYEKKL